MDAFVCDTPGHACSFLLCCCVREFFVVLSRGMELLRTLFPVCFHAFLPSLPSARWWLGMGQSQPIAFWRGSFDAHGASGARDNTDSPVPGECTHCPNRPTPRPRCPVHTARTNTMAFSRDFPLAGLVFAVRCLSQVLTTGPRAWPHESSPRGHCKSPAGAPSACSPLCSGAPRLGVCIEANFHSETLHDPLALAFARLVSGLFWLGAPRSPLARSGAAHEPPSPLWVPFAHRFFASIVFSKKNLERRP
jgi:hypothetical protein